MTIDDSESEDENHLVGNRYNNDDSDTDSEIDFYNLPSVGTKRLVLLSSIDRPCWKELILRSNLKGVS